jgi:serine/threonine protein kinase
MYSIQKPNQTVIFGGRAGRESNQNLNLQQCIVIRFINKAIILTLCNQSQEQQTDSRYLWSSLKKWFDLVKYYGVLSNLRCQYDIGNIIGKGNFAKVYEVSQSSSKRKFALKTINKEMFNDNIKSILSLHDEINLLRKIRHPNVLQLYEIFESDINIHLILEHLNGKELFDQIKERGIYREKEAGMILKCILNALVVLHSNQIVHRDLKPENLIFRD